MRPFDDTGIEPRTAGRAEAPAMLSLPAGEAMTPGNENSCPYGGHDPRPGAECRYCHWVTPGMTRNQALALLALIVACILTVTAVACGAI